MQNFGIFHLFFRYKFFETTVVWSALILSLLIEQSRARTGTTPRTQTQGHYTGTNLRARLRHPGRIATPFAFLPTVSSTISLSFQSSFHLSLTVLVRYRSLAHIQLWMKYTTLLKLHSQATRLDGGASPEKANLDHKRDFHPLWCPIPGDLDHGLPLIAPLRATVQ